MLVFLKRREKKYEEDALTRKQNRPPKNVQALIRV